MNTEFEPTQPTSLATAVSRFLHANPSFIQDHPEFWPQTQDEEQAQSNVVDFRDIQLNRLRREFDSLRQEKEQQDQYLRALVRAIDGCEKACDALNAAQGFEEKIHTITNLWADLMGLKWCFIAFETSRENIQHLRMPGLYRLSSGSIERVLQNQDIFWTQTAQIESMVFGKVDTNQGSSCLMRLSFPQGFEAIIGLGSDDTTSLLQTPENRMVRFLAQCAQLSLSSCLPKTQSPSLVEDFKNLLA